MAGAGSNLAALEAVAVESVARAGVGARGATKAGSGAMAAAMVAAVKVAARGVPRAKLDSMVPPAATAAWEAQAVVISEPFLEGMEAGVGAKVRSSRARHRPSHSSREACGPHPRGVAWCTPTCRPLSHKLWSCRGWRSWSVLPPLERCRPSARSRGLAPKRTRATRRAARLRCRLGGRGSAFPARRTRCGSSECVLRCSRRS